MKNIHTNTTKCINRRSFLKKVSATAAGALAIPLIIPSRALGRGGVVAPSERICLGAIGIGSRGWGVLSTMVAMPEVQFLAVCDVRKTQREAVAKLSQTKYGSPCATFSDIRPFLRERSKDLDAVLIATGNRWHAPASIMAMRAGLDVYCEKPGCMTIAQGQLLVQAARQLGRVYTAGCQRLSESPHVFAAQMARGGRLGKLHTIYADCRAGQALRFDALPAEPEPPKDEIDWDAWLGPVPFRPYNKSYVFQHYSRNGWGAFYDLGHDVAEWGAHTIAQAMAGIDMTAASPVEVEYAPRDKNMTLHLANGIKIVLVRAGGLSGASPCFSGSCGNRFVGADGWIEASDGSPRPQASSPALLADYKKVLREYTARTGRTLNHGADFFECVRTRREPVAGPQVMLDSMALNIAADIALQLKRSVKLDLKKMEFLNDPEANRLRSRGLREPWGTLIGA